MKQHLVESHLGGYYLSGMDEEFITEMCDECGDNDNILLTFDDAENDSLLNELRDYIISSYLLSTDQIDHIVKINQVNNKIDLEEIIRFLPDTCEFKYEELKYFIDTLQENIIIDKLTHRKLAYLNTITLKKALKEIRLYKENNLSISIRTRGKVD